MCVPHVLFDHEIETLSSSLWGISAFLVIRPVTVVSSANFMMVSELVVC